MGDDAAYRTFAEGQATCKGGLRSTDLIDFLTQIDLDPCIGLPSWAKQTVKIVSKGDGPLKNGHDRALSCQMQWKGHL